MHFAHLRELSPSINAYTRMCFYVEGLGLASPTYIAQPHNSRVVSSTSMSGKSISQPNDHDAVLDFVVHSFDLEATRTAALLDIGRDLIHAATSSGGWINVGENLSENPSSSSRSMSDYLFGMNCATYLQGASNMLVRN